ncbi:hypothetical protein TeGR_g9918 [Tetraparma gracilis]|uniref:Uncharacterized protein n=1 Tax=Tetraparma gracilis TaxID=2962635 RepID=A0ABQ6N359_9STRA|nr:hypothetical protein TeGR_g9918 [Tetraparma gracilis]
MPSRQLEFSFEGYTIWLIPRGAPSLMSSIRKVARSLLIEAVPAPHLTLFYGVPFPGDEAAADGAAREAFRGVRDAVDAFPPLTCTGCVCDVELAGVDGGLMSMSWAEISYKKSGEAGPVFRRAHGPFHRHVGQVKEGGSHGEEGGAERLAEETWKAWIPHMSLAYDNVDDNRLHTASLLNAILQTPGLMQSTREIVGLELWRTEGRMCDWERLDGYTFEGCEEDAEAAPAAEAPPIFYLNKAQAGSYDFLHHTMPATGQNGVRFSQRSIPSVFDIFSEITPGNTPKNSPPT